MTRVDDAARVLDMVGLAAWFGGSLVGTVALANGSDGDDLKYENEVWRRWSPVQTAAITAHLVGSAKLAATNKGRLGAQRGVSSVAIVKGVCTVGALGATFYASRLGREAFQEAQQDGEEPSAERSATLRRLRRAQMAVPVLTGAMIVADARLGEQQRPAQVLKGMAERMVPDALHSIPDALHALPDALHSLPDALQSMPEALQSIPDALRSVPVADTSREVVAKASELGRSASHSSLGEPIRQALRH